MTKTDKQAQETSIAGGVMKPLEDAGQHSFSLFGAEWLVVMTKLRSETMAFVATRLKEDMQAQQDLLQAKEIGEVQAIQTRFFEKAVDDYTAEATKLMQIATATASQTRPHATPV